MAKMAPHWHCVLYLRRQVHSLSRRLKGNLPSSVSAGNAPHAEKEKMESLNFHWPGRTASDHGKGAVTVTSVGDVVVRNYTR